MNPYNNGFGLFVYGTLPIFIVRIVAEIANHAQPDDPLLDDRAGYRADLTSYGGIYLVGRAVSALFDVGSVWLLFVLGRRLYRAKVGLLAAAFYAFAALPLQQSHFFTVDTVAHLLRAGHPLLRRARGAGRRAEAGMGAGGARTSRSAPAWAQASPAASTWRRWLGIALLAAGIRAWDDWRACCATAAGAAQRCSLRLRWSSTLLQATLFRFLLMGLVAIAVFRIAQPYAFGGTTLLDFSLATKWLENMKEISRTMRLEVEMPPAHQWANRTPFVFPFVNMVVWGMGLPLGLTAWAGWLVAAVEVLRPDRGQGRASQARPHILPVVWIGGMFLWQGMQAVAVHALSAAALSGRWR